MHDQKIIVRVFICLPALILAACSVLDLPFRQVTDFSPHQTVSPAFTNPAIASPKITLTPQPTPGVLDCAEIVKAHSESTAADWEGAKILLRGAEYYYTGTVFSVTEHDEVHLTGSLCHATLHHVPHEIAITLSHGQFIEGYGTIASIGFNRGEDVDIEANPDLIFVR
jgi:hypothetical protein